MVNYGTTTLNNCTISSNSAGEGGGVRSGGAVFGIVPPGFVGTATLINCTISGNTAGYGGGVATQGGIFTVGGDSAAQGLRCDQPDQLHASAATPPTGSGGGLFTNGLGTTTATNTTVSDNSAANGGGLYSRWLCL